MSLRSSVSQAVQTRRCQAEKRAAERIKKHVPPASITRKDLLPLLVICIVYAVLAFTNLGAMRVPQSGYVLEEGGPDIVLKFDEPEHLVYLMYYAGYGAGSFATYISSDGENWEELWLTNNFGTVANISSEERSNQALLRGVLQQYGDMYQWVRRQFDATGQYVALSPEYGSVNLLEIAFLDEEGNVLIPSEILSKSGGEITELTDEPELITLTPTYMTDFYFDEIYHVRTAYEHLHGITPYEVTHPPLGKILIALGISIFGMNPFGWRFFGALAGLLMLPVLYALAKLLFRDTRYASVATILFAADFMHYTQTRIGTVDSFSVLWILLMYLFMYRFACQDFFRQPLRKSMQPLLFSGLFFGLGAATKWICLYAGVGLLLIWILLLVRRYQEYAWAKKRDKYEKWTDDFPRKFRKMIGYTLLYFLVVPACIYLLAYLPYTLVKDGGAYGIADILENQRFMLTYHANLEVTEPHPYASMWYTWPLDIRPVLFYGVHSEVLGLTAAFATFGNPLVWWGGSAASVCLIPLSLRYKRIRSFGLGFVALAGLCQYVPWWFVSRELFIYHFFSVVPFLVLLLVFCLQLLEKKYRAVRVITNIYVGGCIAAFAFFYPVLTGTVVPVSYASALAWLPTWPF